jgi:hypothetical protein
MPYRTSTRIHPTKDLSDVFREKVFDEYYKEGNMDPEEEIAIPPTTSVGEKEGNVCQPNSQEENRISILQTSPIPAWPGLEDKIKEVRQMKPPYFYFYSLPESSCQVSIQFVQDMPHVDTSKPSVQMVSVRKDDWEKGLPFDEKMIKVVEQGSPKIAYLFFLDSLLYVLQSLDRLKEKVAGDKIIVFRMSAEQVRFQEEAQIWLITLYDNWMDKSDKEASCWQAYDKKQCRWEQAMYAKCVASSQKSSSVRGDPTQVIKEYMDGLPAEFAKEEVDAFRQKALEKVPTKQDGTYDMDRIRDECFQTFAEWDVYQAVALFMNYVVENKGLFPEYRQTLLSLFQEFVLKQPARKDWMIKIRNAMMDVLSTPIMNPTSV